MLEIAYAVHLMANVVHPSEAPDVHDNICSTLMIWTKTDEVIASSAAVVAMAMYQIGGDWLAELGPSHSG